MTAACVNIDSLTSRVDRSAENDIQCNSDIQSLIKSACIWIMTAESMPNLCCNGSDQRGEEVEEEEDEEEEGEGQLRWISVMGLTSPVGSC